MFRGINTLSLDAKGRLAVPSRHRERLAALDTETLVLTLNPLDHCLWLYPLREWEVIEAKLMGLSDFDKQSRRTKQIMRGYASECATDSQGRILIPAELRSFASIGKKVVMLGQGNKFEIWDEASWNLQRQAWLDSVGDDAPAADGDLASLSL